MSGLSVLSFGFTRALWEGEGAEDFQRMMSYAEGLDEYIVVANSYKRHRLEPRRLAPHVEAIPTDAHGPLHSVWRMLVIGWRTLRTRRISVIQAQDTLMTGVVAVVLGKLFKVPVNVCIYGPNAYDPHWLASHWGHRLSAPLHRWVMRHCQGLQVDGQLTRRRLMVAGFSSERVHVKPVVPNNLDSFLRCKRATRAEGEPVRLLYVGRFAAQKNLPLLVEILKSLSRRVAQPIELLLVGEGPEKTRLETAFYRAGLAHHQAVDAREEAAAQRRFACRVRRPTEDCTWGFGQSPYAVRQALERAVPVGARGERDESSVATGRQGPAPPSSRRQSVVTFRGPIARNEIAQVFADADIFVLTSDYEGYPRVLMEAAAAALPVVSTAVSGADEAIIDGTTGYIVPVRNAQAAAEKLAALIASPELRSTMGEAGRAHIRGQLDPATNAPAQLAIWRRVALAQDTTWARGTPPQRLLLFNLVTDARHPILGFTTAWIRELAGRVESIDVITMRAGEIDVPTNVRVHSVGKERGFSEPRRAWQFYRLLFRILRGGRIDGCFSHMMPEFSALAGPMLRARRIPLVTWYAHPSVTFAVKLAHFFSNRIVTSLPSAYAYRREKLSVIGQGIDTARFAPSHDTLAADDLVLCVGRISRVKDHPTLLRAFSLLPRRPRLVILGATAGLADEAYAAELRALIAELGLADAVTFAPAVTSSELPAHYRSCAVHVNLTPAGFGDKVAWEAMSCGRPCLVANHDFTETLGAHAEALLFRPGDAPDLAQKLSALLALTAADRADIGADLRRQVERLHALPRLAECILAELAAPEVPVAVKARPRFLPTERVTAR